VLAQDSGERVSNTLVIYPILKHSSRKLGVIFDGLEKVKLLLAVAVWEELRSYQLVGEVMAHQGYDG